jgi:hypothetical protein
MGRGAGGEPSRWEYWSPRKGRDPEHPRPSPGPSLAGCPPPDGAGGLRGVLGGSAPCGAITTVFDVLFKLLPGEFLVKSVAPAQLEGVVEPR